MPPCVALIPMPLSHIQTRTSNKDRHPGNPDKPKPRRKTAEVSEARQQAAEAEKQQEETRTEAAKKLALIEDKLQEEDRRCEAERLTDTNEPQQEIRFPAIRKDRILIDKNGTAHTKSNPKISRCSDSDDDISDTVPRKANQKIKDTGKNKQTRDESEDEVEFDNDKHNSEDDFDSEAASEDDSRRKKRKKTTRGDINKLRKTHAVSGTQSINPKRKITDVDETNQIRKNSNKKNSSKDDKLSGLAPGWDAKRKKQGRSIIVDDDQESDGGNIGYGGLVPDNETDEVEATAVKNKPKKLEDDKVIVIKPNPLAPKKLVEARQGAKHWSVRHLPNEIQDTWEPEVGARLQWKGGSSTDPWNFPKMSEIQGIVNDVYGEGKYKVVEDGPFYGLAQVRVQNWRRTFFEAVKKAVAGLIHDEANAETLKTEKAIASYIAYYLSKTSDDETSVYQWKHVCPETGRRKGFLGGGLIIKTLGVAHIGKLPEVLADFSTEKLVSHALEQWKTGKPVPTSKEFSADNYANKEDYIPVVDAHQKRKTLKKVITHRMTLLFDAMQDFAPERWNSLINEARGFAPEKPVKKKKREMTLPDDVIIIEDESCKRARFVIKDDSESKAE
ncbi:hypothetical protein M378DRAFT_16339 [Amanita muscaria Koide BX008]|uniref:Uncharacterized protein n=1 Tax=Amanita muscaria (strain Koide BX008) TaxID=946122 RepID=A0A0C2WKX9_AMAMK|nr:hypothetical protein M378DRAFT_16339 [Amanita muscaria Koide BX008]